METSTQSKTTPTNPNQRFQMNQSSQSLPPSPQCSPIFIEYQLMKEFVLFQKQEFLHVYISPSYESAFEWFGVMFIHRGLFKGKILRFSIHIHPSYPNCDIPKIIFDPIPCHPLVDEQSGQLNLSTKFSKWNSSCNYIFEIIAFAKQVFEFETVDELKITANIPPENFDIPTDDLMKIIDDKMENFTEKVIQKKRDDKNYIDFTEPEDSSIIDKVRHKLLTEKFSWDSSLNYLSSNGKTNNSNPNTNRYCNTSISGLSWAKKIVYN